MSLRVHKSALSLVFVGIAASAKAAPIQIDYGDINTTTFESFETFSGDQATSQAFNGFTATVSEGNLLVTSASTFCETSGDFCLINQRASDDIRTFDGFDTGTKYFGFELTPIASFDDIEVVVTGLSGSETFNISGNGLFGFGDTSGLTSVAITNLGRDAGFGRRGTGNYGIDDVITGASPMAPIPLPASALLLCMALGVLGLRSGHRRS